MFANSQMIIIMVVVAVVAVALGVEKDCTLHKLVAS